MTTDAPSMVALAGALYDHLAAGDREAIVALLDPDFVGHTTASLPLGLGGTYETPAAMLRDFWGRIAAHYRAAACPQEYTLMEDGRLMCRGFYRGRAKVGGREFTAEFVHLIRFRGSRIVELRQITDSAAWGEALRE
jgi:2-(1,2-epoxy-1,2-dihydrophenyl)acetyl-CoA isomerase